MNRSIENTLAKTLKTIGMITIIGGIVLGIVVWAGVESVSHGYGGISGFVSGLSISLGGVLSGIMFLGFGEGLQLLQDIKTALTDGNSVTSEASSMLKKSFSAAKQESESVRERKLETLSNDSGKIIQVDKADLPDWLNIDTVEIIDYGNSCVFRISGRTVQKLEAISFNAVINNVFGEKKDMGIISFMDIKFDSKKITGFVMEAKIPFEFSAGGIKEVKLTIKECVISGKNYKNEDITDINAKVNNEDILSANWTRINELNNAREIYEFIKELNPNDERYIEEIMPRLQKSAEVERLYGNNKSSVIAFLRQFVDD